MSRRSESPRAAVSRHREPRTQHVVPLPALPLECGAVLRDAVLAFQLDGRLSAARDNVILVLHPLTGSANAAGDWWHGLIGPGLALDTDRFAVLAPNLLGSCYGSTGPADAADGFPPITTRDIARATGVLLERLGIPRVALVTGGSLGGMVALEFAASFPGRAERAVVLAAPAAQGASAIAWGHVQRTLLDACGDDGVALARQVAMLSFRTARGLDRRFGRRLIDEGEGAATGVAFGSEAVAPGRRYEIVDWLDWHGRRLRERFSAASYRTLLDAMDSHDLGRGRVSAAERLRASGTRLTGVGIPGDLLHPDHEVRAWVQLAGGTYHTLASDQGHDAFLIERPRVGAILREALAEGPDRGWTRAMRLAEEREILREAGARTAVFGDRLSLEVA